MAGSKAEFEAVAAAALAMAHILLPQWLGGHKEGHEWLGERKANGGPGDSWKVNLNTGVWAHFGGSGPDAHGGDLIDLYKSFYHVNLGVARDAVAELVGFNGSSVPVLDHQRHERAIPPQEFIPGGSPDPTTNTKLGRVTAVYRYGRQFAVMRIESKDGLKSFKQWTWRKGGW